MNLSKKYKLLLLFFVFLVLTAFKLPNTNSKSDFLWNTINQQCVPNQKANQNPAPCSEVNFLKDDFSGYVIFKDRNGPLHHLLLPATKITGIESPKILKKDSLNYLFLAWNARSYLEKIYKSKINDEEISLTVNSQFGRSQNQLHIHISCIRPDIKKLIDQNISSLTSKWGPFPGGILGHNYFARKITFDEFKNKNAFLMLANDLPSAKSKMNEFSIGLVALKNGVETTDFLLLADQTDRLKMDRGHVEEIQDHTCPQLFAK